MLKKIEEGTMYGRMPYCQSESKRSYSPGGVDESKQ